MAVTEDHPQAVNPVSGEIFGGLAAMLVAMPSAIAFGLVVYAPLGGNAAAVGALAGIVGAITLGLVAPLFGGSPGIITAPCAPAAAVMGGLVGQLVAMGPDSLDPALIPLLLVVTALLSGTLQFLYGVLGAGSVIKFIPFPVVAGYLSGVGLLIFIGQVPKFLGMPKGTHFFDALSQPTLWQTPSLIVGAIAIAGMVFSKKLTEKIPAPIIALVLGITAYFTLSLLYPDLLVSRGNPFVIGPIQAANGPGFFDTLSDRWTAAYQLNTHTLGLIVIPALTLSVLLSIDTLKTGVVLDVLTRSRSRSNRELLGQGVGNVVTALAGGMPGAGTTGPTLVNVSSGGRTKLSGILNGAFALIAFLALGNLVAWIPVAALSGILMVVGVRMIDREAFQLLRRKTTLLDFLVIFAVVVTAIADDLITAAGIGVALAILLFLRDQIRGSVVHRTRLGNAVVSKKRRLPVEMEILEKKGAQTVLVELDGSLFFGTADQLISEIQPLLPDCRYLILDMKRVRFVDFTAVHRLEQLETQLAEQNGCLILTALPRFMSSGDKFKRYLHQAGLIRKHKAVQLFDEIEAALEWTEDQIIEAEGLTHPPEEKLLDLGEIHILSKLSAEELSLLRPAAEERHYAAGENIFKQGDTGDMLYLIRNGSIKIILPLSHGKHHHLATIDQGDFFGDMAFIDQATRSADAIAETECHLYTLSRHAFTQLEESAPHLAEQVFVGLARVLAERLRQADREIRALEDS